MKTNKNKKYRTFSKISFRDHSSQKLERRPIRPNALLVLTAFTLGGITFDAPAFAVDITHVSGPGAWESPTSWIGGVVPGKDDRAIISSGTSSISISTPPTDVRDIGSIWITSAAALNTFPGLSQYAMRFNGTGGIAALNESSTTTTFFQRTILANDLIFRASNAAGGGFRWGGPSLSGAPFAGLDLAGHTVTFDTVNAANAMSFANAFIIQGEGNVIKTGAGTLTIGNVSQYTGSTVIDAGTLALTGSGSIASSSGLHNDGVFDIAGTASGTSIKTLSGAGVVNIGTKALTLTNANGDTFAGSFSGSGGLTLASGTQTLTGDSSAFSGLTTVQSGTLSVNGALGGTMNVLSGGTLQGNGIVGDTTINAGGTLAPGNSIGLLTVQGNLVFAAASSYMVEVSPDNADRTNVTGIGDAGRRDRECALRGRELRREAVHHPQCHGRSRRQHVQCARQHRPAGQFPHQP